jgi:hypothetical protein
MQLVTKEVLEQLIGDAKKARKETSELQETLKIIEEKEVLSPVGETKEKKLKEGTRVIESTGPAREEDFE